MRSTAFRALMALATSACLMSASAWAQTVNGVRLPAQGAKAAVVEIVEVSDFECPYCSKVQSTLEELKAAYPDTLRFVFLHQPLPFHDRALPTALTSVVAQKQGKFWGFKDAIFASQRTLSAESTRRIAVGMGLDAATLAMEVKKPDAVAFVEANRRVANAVGARGTPAFFINGTAVMGAWPAAAFKKIIDIEVALAGDVGGDVKKAKAYRDKRTAQNNADLYAYLYEGKEPPPPGAPETKPQPGPTPGADNEPLFRASVRPDDPVRGDSAKALVTLVAFLGYQCVHSAKAMAAYDALHERYGDRIRLIIKHLPLSIHTHAEEAALAALCAHDQGKFWPMNTHLFANKRLSPSALRSKARAAGLDMAAWKECMDLGTHRKRIREDSSLGQRVGARGTPATFINGRRIMGAVPVEELQAVIDAELVRVQARVDEGMAIGEVYGALMKEAQLLDPLEEAVITLDLTKAPTRGDRKAPVQLVVFSDYQCPYCMRLEPSLLQLYQRYAGRVAVTVKHYPLSFHKEARGAAEAAYCAHKQGKFWPMHDTLFMDIEHLGPELTEGIAQRIGLDMEHYEACLAHPSTGEAIDADMADAHRIGLQGTPTLLFNGRRYDMGFGTGADDLAQTVDYLLDSIDSAK